jgi:hypothetical protein
MRLSTPPYNDTQTSETVYFNRDTAMLLNLNKLENKETTQEMTNSSKLSLSRGVANVQPLLVSIPRQINLVHNTQSFPSMVHVNNILPPKSKSS